MSLPVLIAGGGVGGLAAALALAQQGLKVDVFERAPHLQELGAGLQLTPNASRILFDLGLKDLLRPHVCIPQRLVVRDGLNGDTLQRVPLGSAIESRFGAGWWVASRPALQQALLEKVRQTPHITLNLNRSFAGCEEDHACINVTVAHDQGTQTIKSSALIGADGVWSSVRRIVAPDCVPLFSGRTAWRTLLPIDHVPSSVDQAAITLWLMPHLHVVHYLIDGGKFLNVVAVVPDTWNEPGWSIPAQGDGLRPFFDPGCAALRAIHYAADTWMRWALHTMTPARQLAKGRIALIGDAAHPTLPFLAQGAAMALEDAAVLGDCFAKSASCTAALQRYEWLRMKRVQKVVSGAQFNAHVFSWPNPWRWARNFALKLMPHDAFIDKYAWIYGFRATDSVDGVGYTAPSVPV